VCTRFGPRVRVITHVKKNKPTRSNALYGVGLSGGISDGTMLRFAPPRFHKSATKFNNFTFFCNFGGAYGFGVAD